MKTYITGAGGMVGSHMIERLFNSGDEVLGSYYKPTTDITEIDARIKLVECDVRYYQSVLKIIQNFKPDRIFHLAAQSYPTVSWSQPQATIDTNINGTINIFEAIKATRFVDPKYNPMVVVACSSAEYGATLDKLNGEEVYVKETAELLPLHPYGVSKVGQDLLSYQYFMNDGIRCIRARIFNSTGTRKVNDVTSDFTKRAILALRSGDFTLKVGNLNTSRAIMDQRDLVAALILLSEKGIAGEVYNISSEHIYKMTEIIKLIEDNIGYKFNVVVDNSLLRSTDEKIIVGDITKLKKDTGWKQQIPMSQTVADMLDYWKRVLK